jgi:uncharacterized cupin superfamily protein
MHCLNFLDDEPWDEVQDQFRQRVRWFGHPLGTDMLGASLTELLPGASGGQLHMHYGLEEMFFVLSGTPTVRTPQGEEQLSAGTSSTFPKARKGCTRSRTRRMSRCDCSGSRPSGSQMSSPTRSRALPGWPRAIPSAQCPRALTKESSPASICLATGDARS